MPDETDRKMMEILRILAEQDKVLGAKTIAEELKRKGYNLGERAVRYHMRILDEKGFTERIGYAGREITEKGLKELDKGLIYDQVDFSFSKFEGMSYADIAATMGLSTSAIKSLLTRARHNLRLVLEPYVQAGESLTARLPTGEDELD